METTSPRLSDVLRRGGSRTRRFTIRPAGRLGGVPLHHVVDTVTGEIMDDGCRVTFDRALRVAEACEQRARLAG